MMKVTQEDREAAARIYGAFRDYHNAKAAEDGHLDDGCVVQAFAQHRTTALAAKEAELAAVKAREAKLRACLGFFASVIKSGEPWTATCEQRYRAALAGETP